ncbi:hypothetical protein A1O3_04056 [Capronia epimyces CBS 606.96]|uniref:DUF7708 domain-containing protein n=1 Tax=Capronia epimyces CBS 606.96 TaxID=1182542 RepID=W9Y3M0_9EURO|nr:uncharacterized protein A1O3_04056 [Capronia epimyces CBS 606.96]EXJ87098.1 hypothetical protein A1O3_04056 [Capronia epimyces CBS 606.96]
MGSLTRQTDWYRGDTARNGADVAKEAFDKAMQYFEKDLHADKKSLDWLRSHWPESMHEVTEVVEQAKQTYTTTRSGKGKEKESKAHKCLVAFSARVRYYGDVLDVLAQHHPEYVALAWGAFKFVFVGVLNHAELVAELSEALTKIGDLLQQVKLVIYLYPVDRMRDAVSRLYAHMIEFLLLAADWYKKHPIKRALDSIINPFPLRYKPTLKLIQSSFDNVNHIANGANKAETRDLTIAVQQMQSQITAMETALVTRMTEMQGIGSQTLAVVKDQTVRLCRMEQGDILTLLTPSRLPEHVLSTCRSIARRRGLWNQPSSESTSFVQALNKWIASTDSTLFTVRAGPRAEARTKDLAVEVTALLSAAWHPVLWYLSERGHRHRHRHPQASRDVDVDVDQDLDQDLSLCDILKNLIYQLVRQDVGLDPDTLNITKFHSAHSESEWLDLLLLLLRSVCTCYMVIETEALYDLAGKGKDQGWSQRLMAVFDRVVENAKPAGCLVKVLLVTYSDAPLSHRTISTTSSTASNHSLPLAVNIHSSKTGLMNKRQRVAAKAAGKRNGLTRQLATVHLVDTT